MAFDVRKHIIRVQGGREYLPVAFRLVWFREEHPDFGIDTQVVELDLQRGVAVFSATVTDHEGRLLAAGVKMESAANFADFVEKASTGAIGRALGVLGYGTQFAPEFGEGERIVDAPRGNGNGNGYRPNRAEPTGALACEECGRPLTKGQRDVSVNKFGRPLCPKHQQQSVTA
ncbi:MAG TPA: hypothetical protein VGM51_06980 [Armatimonadota bacterium]|jgi:hypothetical protein